MQARLECKQIGCVTALSFAFQLFGSVGWVQLQNQYENSAAATGTTKEILAIQTRLPDSTKQRYGTLVLTRVTGRLFRWREFISIIFLGLDTVTQIPART
jgi:hypothetical protein